MSWYTPGLALETSTRFGSGGKGGFMSGLKHAFGGGQLFLTEYTAPPSGGMVAFAARMPGVIRELRIDPADEFQVQSGGDVAGTTGVEVSVALQKTLGAGMDLRFATVKASATSCSATPCSWPRSTARATCGCSR